MQTVDRRIRLSPLAPRFWGLAGRPEAFSPAVQRSRRLMQKPSFLFCVARAYFEGLAYLQNFSAPPISTPLASGVFFLIKPATDVGMKYLLFGFPPAFLGGLFYLENLDSVGERCNPS